MQKRLFPMGEESGAEGHRARNVKFHADSSSKERREEKLRKYFTSLVKRDATPLTLT